MTSLLQRTSLARGPAVQKSGVEKSDFEESWMTRLPEGERAVLAVLAEAYPQAVERSQIDEMTSYKRSSRDAYLQRLSAKRLVVTERGAVRANAQLFD